MYYLKTRYFNRWARKQGLTPEAIENAIAEFEDGLHDADLGNNFFKKRVALPGRGKRGSTRTILFYREEEKLVFCIGFAKNEKDNISEDDKKTLKALAKWLDSLSDKAVQFAIEEGDLVNIDYGETEDGEE